MKTTKSQKTQYRNEITAFEFLKANPDLTSSELAKALGRGVGSISSHVHQLHAIGRIIQTGSRDGVPTWRVNDMPFGCSSPIRMMFDNLLKECRATA